MPISLAFMAELRDQAGTAARCLEFAILTGARTGEAIGASGQRSMSPPGVDRAGPRMKAGKAHVVPLGDRALEILAELPRTGDFVFERCSRWPGRSATPPC